MRYQLVVFDWDGTLMDSAGRIVACVQAAAREAGVAEPSPEAAREIIGLGLDEAIDALFDRPADHLARRIRDAYRAHWLDDKLAPAPLFEGAGEMLAALEDQGYLLAVATGKSRRGLDKALRETGLGQRFVFTRCADEAYSKPHPQMLLDILERTGVDAADTVVVGDTEYDMAMAGNAGASALGVSHGVHEPGRLLRTGAIVCLDHLSEIPDWLEQAA